jgi:hypothetical protein
MSRAEGSFGESGPALSLPGTLRRAADLGSLMVRLAIHVPWGGQQQRGAWGRCGGQPHDATRPDINRSARQLFLLTNF